MKSVYLSGPITGCTYEGCTDWRRYVAEKLAPDVVAVSPLRGKDYLKGRTSMPHTLEGQVLSSQAGIMARDRFDTMACDALLANFLGVTWEAMSEAYVKTGRLDVVRTSIGTCMEVAWADMLRKPIVLVIEPKDNIHDHPMIREAAGFRVDSLDEATLLLNALLSEEFARQHQ